MFAQIEIVFVNLLISDEGLNQFVIPKGQSLGCFHVTLLIIQGVRKSITSY